LTGAVLAELDVVPPDELCPEVFLWAAWLFTLFPGAEGLALVVVDVPPEPFDLAFVVAFFLAEPVPSSSAFLLLRELPDFSEAVASIGSS
jgi:hypothetical protein